MDPGVSFKTPTCLFSLCVPCDGSLGLQTGESDLLGFMAEFIGTKEKREAEHMSTLKPCGNYLESRQASVYIALFMSGGSLIPHLAQPALFCHPA